MTFRFTGDDGIPNDTGVSYVWFTDGSSVTKVRKRGGAPLNWTLLGAADLNGDGAADMAYISPTGDVRILMATPSRTCANLSAGTIPAGYTALGLADFTGNNRGDILIRNTITGAVKILSMDARGLTLPAYGGTPDDPNASCTASSLVIPVTTYSMGTADPTWTYYATGDFNGDGIFDVIWQRPDGTLTVWLLGTNGAPAVIVNSAGTAPAGFTVFQVGGGGGTGVAQAASTKAEGIYAGTTSTGYSFDSIFLEDDTFWTVYGVPTASGGLTVYGFDQGSGTSANGSYTALNAKDFFHTGVVSTGNLTATYVPNQSISGSFGTGTFSGTKPVTTAYSYGNPAQLVDIVGTWTGNLLDSSVASITIAANGAFTGTNVGCSFSGTITPRASGKSVFNVSLTFGGAPCALSGQTVGGIGLWVNVGASSKQLVIPVVNTGKTLGTIFFAVR